MHHEKSYSPDATPDAAQWLKLPERERLRVVSTFHMVNRLKSGNAKAHAAIHVIVESQIATGFGPTVRAMARLQREGLSRHESLHAVGSVLSSNILEAMRKPPENNSQAIQSQINAAIERLSAQSWRQDYGA